MGLRGLLYGAYERRLAAGLDLDRIPHHVGVILDGNRRWARMYGDDESDGHRRGADKIRDFLGWCEQVDVEVVTLWLLSTDNLARAAADLDPLLRIIEQTVSDLAAERRWRLHPVGALDLLPDATRAALKSAEAATADVTGMLVNVAVGYGGRREITDAVRSLLQRARGPGHHHRRARRGARRGSHRRAPVHAGAARPRPGHPHVGRAAAVGGFLLWQSAHSEFYFCDAYWPAFRHGRLPAGAAVYGRASARYADDREPGALGERPGP